MGLNENIDFSSFVELKLHLKLQGYNLNNSKISFLGILFGLLLSVAPNPPLHCRITDQMKSLVNIYAIVVCVYCFCDIDV